MFSRIVRSPWNVDRPRPVVASHWAVQRITGGNYSRDGAELLLQFAISDGQLLQRVAIERMTDMHYVSMICLESEVLVLEFLQALDQQECP